MTDLELLEMAAKAAGYEVDCGFADCPLIYGQDAGPDGPRDWNPLTDDGDALRLAVKCAIDISPDYDGTYAEAVIDGEPMWASGFASNGDLYAATRRAIVRVAAEIGRAMP